MVCYGMLWYGMVWYSILHYVIFDYYITWYMTFQYIMLPCTACAPTAPCALANHEETRAHRSGFDRSTVMNFPFFCNPIAGFTCSYFVFHVRRNVFLQTPALLRTREAWHCLEGSRSFIRRMMKRRFRTLDWTRSNHSDYINLPSDLGRGMGTALGL